MKKTLVVALSISFLVVAGCATKNTSNSQALSNYYSTRTERVEPQKIEKKWIKLIEGSDLMYEEGGQKLSDGSENFNKYEWDDFLKQFIEGLPKEKRDAPLKFLIGCKPRQDKLEKRIFFACGTKVKQTLGWFIISGNISKGEIEADVLLGLNYDKNYSMDKNFGARGFKVFADDFNYEFELEFTNTAGFSTGKLGFLDSKKFSFLNAIAEAKSSTVRIYGKQYYYDYNVNTEDKEYLKLALKAFKEITQVSEEKITPTNNINIQMHEIQHKKKAHK